MEFEICSQCFHTTNAVGSCPQCGSRRDQENKCYQLPVGTVLQGRYRVGIDCGGNSWTMDYYGWDSVAQKRVILREFFPGHFVYRSSATGIRVETHGEYDGYLREFRQLAARWMELGRLPGMEQILDCFAENNTAYLVLEPEEEPKLWFDGQPVWKWHSYLRTLLQDLEPVMDSLQHIHEHGLIHGDICPRNLLDFQTIVFYDGREEVRARLRPLSNPGKATQHWGLEMGDSSAALPVAPYAAPEQFRMKGVTDPSTDVYGLCATIYRAASGKEPVDALSRLLNDKEVDWGAMHGLSQNQREAVIKGMSLHQADRFQSMQELKEALRDKPISGWEVFQPSVSAPPQPPVQPPALPVPPASQEKPASRPLPKRKRKLPWLLGALAAILAGLLILGGEKNAEPEPSDTTPASTTRIVEDLFSQNQNP